ncbi:hypothetical protein ACHAWF_003433 [Thalassiosira exigua]
MCIAKSKVNGEPVGSLAVQTVNGAKDSRLVIKIGALNLRESENDEGCSGGLFAHDLIRFRVRWPEMRLILKDCEKGGDHQVAQIMFHRFTVDFQRLFTEEVSRTRFLSSERAQFSIVVHNVQITDCSPNRAAPLVFNSMSDKSFFDLCIRTRGPLDADLIRVDLFDLNIAFSEGQAEKVIVNTGEDFVWRLLDIANRTMLATTDLAGVDLDLKWDDKAGKFSVAISDPRLRDADDLDLDGKYRPPRSDKLYDVKKLRVSPFIVLLSFKRQPQSSRYKLARGVRGAKLTNYFTTRLKFTIDRADLRFQGFVVREIKGPPDLLADTVKAVYVAQPQSSRYKLARGVRGAKLTNYFTTRLKFTIDRADLRFQGYMVRDIKGPPDRLADTVKAVYTTQLKSKMVILLTASSVQDWKYLTARDTGGEEFIEGDLLRMTGNLAGRSVKFVLKKSGDYIGDSVMAVTGTIGGGIQDATETVGLGQVGAGVNSIVSGLGEGVSSGVKGVGTGAGDILRGAGKGLGQVVGGLGGGVQIVGKGIVKGVAAGDGKQLVSEVGTGFATMGDGFGQGFGTAVEGTVSGVFSAGRGLFSGAKSVGKGLGGAFTGQSQEPEPKPGSGSRRSDRSRSDRSRSDRR